MTNLNLITIIGNKRQTSQKQPLSTIYSVDTNGTRDDTEMRCDDESSTSCGLSESAEDASVITRIASSAKSLVI